MFFIIIFPVYMNVINNDKNVINNKPLSNRKLSDSCPSSFVKLSDSSFGCLILHFRLDYYLNHHQTINLEWNLPPHIVHYHLFRLPMELKYYFIVRKYLLIIIITIRFVHIYRLAIVRKN